MGGSKINEALEEAFEARQKTAKAVFVAKQADYGPENIARGGEYGVALRAQDKVARLLNLLADGKAPMNEAVKDAWMDLANYGIIGWMVHEGAWPTPSPPILEDTARAVADIVRSGGSLGAIKAVLEDRLFGKG